jgi:hypothetical protein
MPVSDFEGRPLAELSSGAQFALWALRTRVHCMKTGDAPNQRLGHGFELAGLQPSLRSFEQLFEWLTRSAHRNIYLGCPKCRRVSEDESLLLGALAAFQEGDSASGEILLGSFMPRTACLNAAQAALQLARAMAAADLPIAARPEAGPTARAGEQAPASAARWAGSVPTSDLIH